MAIAVAAVNDPPVANAQSVTTNQDTAKAISLTATDVDGDPLSYAVVAAPTHGTLSGVAPNLTYTPAAGYFGPDSFTFKANDGTVDSAAATVSLTVVHVNHAPVAAAQTVTTTEDTARAVVLTATDADGDPLTYSVVAGPTHGALSGTAPNLTYTPALNYNGPDSFTFTAKDATLVSTTATVTITVTPVNDPPVANAQSVTTAEDTAAPIVLTGSDVDGDALTYAVATQPAHGTLSGTAPNVTYTPALNYNGPDSFTFTVKDATLVSTAATVSITVTPVNDAPIANAQSVTTAEDTAKAITLSGSDVDGDTLTYAIATQPAHGTLTGTAPNVTYTPALNYNGPDSFTFTVKDAALTSATATVSITVTAVNHAPTANAQSVTTAEDTAKAITLTGSDVDGDALTFSIATQPAHGTLSGTAPNVTYTPVLNYNGPDSFTFTVKDATLVSTAATVTITVTAVNDAPVANAQSVTTVEDTAKAITLSGSDVDGDTLTYAIATQPAHGTLTGTAPNMTYTPALNYNGPDSFTFTTKDATLVSTAATVTITVTAVNHAPVANAQSVTAATATARSITLTASDVDNNPLTYSIVAAPAHGTLTGTAPNVTYTSAAGYVGADSFTFKVNDGTVDSAAATVSLTVTAVNNPPTVGAITWNVPVDPVKLGVAITGTASVTNAQTATWSWGDGTTSAGTISGTSVSGSRTYTAAGVYTVTLTVKNAANASATSVFQYVAVIDLLAGSETGVGSINSPVGSYTANPSVAGTASISQLTAKYGADGTLGALTNAFRFSYSAAGFTFSSLSMKWLVISGNKSWLRGEGAASGVTDPCYFLVSVVDNTTTLDKVRVKIWNKVTGKVIYDNQKDSAGISAPDDAAAVQSSTSPSTVMFLK
ncbi:MAG: hypothetical protein DMG02_01355 [Acidobacteria bacterium]|nr:MAG: hypothetical protein DMG02_01355 [Acidobacteriota bacterium]